MGLLSDILSVLFGTGYVTHKACKECPDGVAFVGKWFGVLVGLFLIPYIIVYKVLEHLGSTENVFGFILRIAILAIPFAIGGVGIKKMLDDDEKKVQHAQSPEGIKDRKNEMYRFMNETGLKIKRVHTDKLVDDPTSPLHTKLKVTRYECLNWLCWKRQHELEYLSESEIDKLLGIRLRDIPLNPNLAPGKAFLQRQALAVEYIMKSEGLTMLSDIGTTVSFRYPQTDYYKKFPQYVADARAGKKDRIVTIKTSNPKGVCFNRKEI